MNEGVPYADIVILALIAGFILLRLRSVLGQKQDSEKDFIQRLKPVSDTREPIVQLTDKTAKKMIKDEPDTALALITDQATVAALSAIKAKDPQFSVTRFIEGAKGAFEMVHDAFNKGDKPTLIMLLSDSLASEFTAEVDARAKQDNKTETTLVAIVSKDIKQASLSGNMARITVGFTSEQVIVVRNEKKEIVEGNPSEVHHVEDEWVFERDVTSKNPNWKIIET